ncbi:YbdK family carboxylate-amine ligase [Microbacterium paludicola]|uniref:carboxylate-amine ligase n=1 Tax=Microbacterium paludicola TaxID=300019 RepID=UPI0011A0ADAE|nr:YbdK family carboxylate-amine ligase [Microbacterium paludicola]
MTRFGMEEEFQLLDEDTLIPIPLGAAACAALPGGMGRVTTEFLTSQVEFSTSPAATLADAAVEIGAMRTDLQAFAQLHRSVAAATGTPFGPGPAASVVSTARYAAIAGWLGHIVDGHHVNGLHLHVEIIDVEERVRALNAVRPWLATLLALSGNSPFADGQDTGHHSWRTILLRRLPLAGCPPHFHDSTHYHQVIGALVEQDILPDVASVSWAARMSDLYPTLELRIFDAQLTAEDALLCAAIGRALALSAPPAGVLDDAALQASVWAAARSGLDATLLHPDSGEPAPARAMVGLLRERITAALEENGDAAFVEEGLDRVLREGTGASRQRAAYAEGGTAALGALYRSASGGEAHDAGDEQ